MSIKITPSTKVGRGYIGGPGGKITISSEEFLLDRDEKTGKITVKDKDGKPTGNEAELNNVKIIDRRIDSHSWIRSLRLEYWRVAQIRQLRVGEVFWIGFFDGPGVIPEVSGHCEACIERVKGGYEFMATWTIRMGKPLRPHILTFGDLNLLPGNIVKFKAEKDVQAERLFRTVCRYIAFIHRHRKRFRIDGDSKHRNPLFRGEIVFRNGLTLEGVPGPLPEGLGSIVKVFETLDGLEMEEKTE